MPIARHHIDHQSAPLNDERGAVLLEWALVVFGLVIGQLMFTDLSNMLTQYQLMSQAAFEGARFAANLPHLEPSREESLQPTAALRERCEGGGGTETFPCGHYLIQLRVRYALQQLVVFTSGSAGQMDYTTFTQYQHRDGGVSSSDTVTVEVRGIYNGYLLQGLPITAVIQGGYLLEERQ